MSRQIGLLFVAAVLASLSVAPAFADEASTPINVKVNMARILRISAPASTVIVGNPAVADVTIQDPQTLVLTGKSYGQTNMIVLDSKGNPIADTLVEVVQSQADIVTMYSAGQRNTMACAPSCHPMVMVGDYPGYTQELIQSMGLIQGVAQ
jgi:Flp pilus assembly secretin CpaC